MNNMPKKEVFLSQKDLDYIKENADGKYSEYIREAVKDKIKKEIEKSDTITLTGRMREVKINEYRCEACGAFVSVALGVTSLKGEWLCDKDECRTLTEDNDAIKVSSW